MDVTAWLGIAATVAQLAVPDVVGGIISKILEMAATACQNKEECEQLAGDVRMILTLLPSLQLQQQDSEVMRQPLAELVGTLQEALQLVESCQRTSLPMRVIKTTWQARKYKEVRSKIKFYLAVFSVRSHIDVTRRLDEIASLVLAIANNTGVPVPSPTGSQTQSQLEGAGADAVDLRRPLQDHIVTAYVGYGSLYDHLQSPPSSSPVAASMKKRVEVLLCVAHDIERMHRYSRPSVVHGHITSSNILLDGASVTCKPAQDTEGAGYVDPEYRRTRRLTPASDVYSLGVVMLEAVTGMGPFVATRDDEGNKVVDGLATLPCYVRRFIEAGELWKVLDYRPAPEPTPWQLEALGLVAHAALCCVRREGTRRPAISDVLDRLEIAHQLFCSSDE